MLSASAVGSNLLWLLEAFEWRVIWLSNWKVLSFTYNAMGDLEKASSANVDRIVNTYDLYGRKTNIVDVDKGSWSYVTNGFGEVISQTNGNAQTTTNTYDNGGRLVRQYDPSGTICWSYGTTAAA